MQVHFIHLSFNIFVMIQRNPQSNGFWPLQLPFEDLGVHQDSNFQNGNSFGSVRVHSLTFFCTPRNMRCDPWVSLLAHNLANPCFGREPKVRVATRWRNQFSFLCLVHSNPICKSIKLQQTTMCPISGGETSGDKYYTLIEINTNVIMHEANIMSLATWISTIQYFFLRNGNFKKWWA